MTNGQTREEAIEEMAQSAHMADVLGRFIEACSSILPKDRLPAPTGDLRADAFAMIVAIHTLSGELIEQFGGMDWLKNPTRLTS